MNAMRTGYGFIFISLMLLRAGHQLNAQPAALPTTPSMVKELLERSAQRGVHPRLFFSEDDILRLGLLESKGDPLIRLGHRQLQEEARSVLSQPYLTYFLDDARLRVPSVHKFALQVPPLVMMYRLTGDTAYAERAIRQVVMMAGWPDWGADRHYLDAGIGAFNVAMIYDGLFGYLDDARKKVIRDAVMKHVLIPGKRQMEKRAWWSTSNNNWNGICNGGIVMAALAMYEEDPAGMSEVISLAVNNLPKYLNSFEPDGQSEEGVMYWSYGLTYTILALESMQRVAGSTFGLDRPPGFMKTGWFPALVSGPVTTLNIGDDPLKDSRSRSFFWFARQYKDTALALLQYDLCRETQVMSWSDMLYYEPEVITATAKRKSILADNHVRGIEVMSLRTGWDRDATFVSMHGGRNDANHGHLDAGTFDIQAMGEVWAYGNMGRDDYTFPGYFTKKTLPDYFDRDTLQYEPGRWHFYRLRAEGKNCLVFDPGIRADQDEKGVAVKKRSSSDASSSFHVLDLADCYKRDVDAYQRAISLDKRKRIISIQDEFVMKQAGVAWWQMHTRAMLEISEDGRTVVMTQAGKKMIARIAGPSGARFSELPATYLPGRSFPLTRNSPNEGFKKLVIRLDAVKEGRLRVDFMPAGTVQSAKEKQVAAMESWRK